MANRLQRAQALHQDFQSLQAVSQQNCLEGGGYQGANMSQDVRAGHFEGAHAAYHSYDMAYSGRTLARAPAAVHGLASIRGDPVRYGLMQARASRVAHGLMGALASDDAGDGVGNAPGEAGAEPLCGAVLAEEYQVMRAPVKKPAPPARKRGY